MSRISRTIGLASACALFAWAQGPVPAASPARIVVTVGHHYGNQAPALTRDDLTVTQEYKPLPITNLIPLRGDRAALELFMLVDGCSNCEPGSKFDELRRFISSQPPSTSIGVGYITNGKLEIAVKPTQDRERAIQALNAPEGSKPADPFRALTELIDSWPPDVSRRAVLMVSNGMDPALGDAFRGPSVETAIEAAQRSGVTIYAIYHPSADYVTADSSKIYSGQIQLAHLAVESGGEAYFLDFGPLPSLAPFLSDIADHLANQYLVEFVAVPGEAGALEPVTVRSKVADIELVVPAKVWVPGSTRAPRHRTGN